MFTVCHQQALHIDYFIPCLKNFWFAHYIIAAMLVVINIRFLISSFCCTTNMAATPLSFGSLGIGCKPPIYTLYPKSVAVIMNVLKKVKKGFPLFCLFVEFFLHISVHLKTLCRLQCNARVCLCFDSFGERTL